MRLAKYLLLALGLLSAGLALGQSDRPGITLRWSDPDQALTEAAPTLVTEGMPLADVVAYRVSISAESTRTLSGGGTLKAYRWENDLARWERVPSLDLSLTQCAGLRDCSPWDDFEVLVPSGRIFYAASSVTVSAGTTVAVLVKAHTKVQSP